jgi:transketolase
MSAAHHKLENLICIVDRNHVQIDGKTEEVMQLEPLTYKWEAFGWKVLACDGNSIEELVSNLNKAKSIQDKPTVIIAKTSMGKGIKSIENDYRWHGRAPSKTEFELFLKELY